jgi:hypothetical protein
MKINAITYRLSAIQVSGYTYTSILMIFRNDRPLLPRLTSPSTNMLMFCVFWIKNTWRNPASQCEAVDLRRTLGLSAAYSTCRGLYLNTYASIVLLQLGSNNSLNNPDRFPTISLLQPIPNALSVGSPPVMNQRACGVSSTASSAASKP